jgi:Brp/Blh family beta-carotene 15,15'-monooxygenase
MLAPSTLFCARLVVAGALVALAWAQPALSRSLTLPLLALALAAVGVPHGAVDHLHAHALFGAGSKKVRLYSIAMFYVVYCGLALLYAMAWAAAPAASLYAFFLFSAYHFGQGELHPLLQLIYKRTGSKRTENSEVVDRKMEALRRIHSVPSLLDEADKVPQDGPADGDRDESEDEEDEEDEKENEDQENEESEAEDEDEPDGEDESSPSPWRRLHAALVYISRGAMLFSGLIAADPVLCDNIFARMVRSPDFTLLPDLSIRSSSPGPIDPGQGWLSAIWARGMLPLVWHAWGGDSKEASIKLDITAPLLRDLLTVLHGKMLFFHLAWALARLPWGSWKKERRISGLVAIQILDFFLLIGLVRSLDPLQAFAVYFSLFHSLPHLRELRICLPMPTHRLMLAAAPYTLAAAGSVAVACWMWGSFSMSHGGMDANEIIAWAFIGVSVVTLPHVILVECHYLYGRPPHVDHDKVQFDEVARKTALMTAKRGSLASRAA